MSGTDLHSAESPEPFSPAYESIVTGKFIVQARAEGSVALDDVRDLLSITSIYAKTQLEELDSRRVNGRIGDG